jgi:uncharacterized protein YdbL (DUF1318 family)
MRPRFIPLPLAALAFAFALPAAAQAGDGDSSALRASGVVGEQATGYMAPAPGGALSDEQRRSMDQINIKRRAFYTDKAAAAGVTVAQYAQVTACEIFSHSLQPGQWYRDENGSWRKRDQGPTPLPSWCQK